MPAMGRPAKYSASDVEAWTAMYMRNATLQEISAETGVAIETVWRRLRDAGVALRDRNRHSKAVHQRFERKYTPEPNTGCWLWLHGTQAAGYGFFKHAGEITAHRVAWILYRGEIPGGLSVLHRCDVPQCVNPEHLFLGTQADNMRDMTAKGRWSNQATKGNRK